MKHRLNLFSQRSTSKKVVSYYILARKIALIVFVFLVLLVSALGGIFYYLNGELSILKSKEQTYTRYILTNKAFSEDIQHFVFKFKKLKSYIDSDAQSFAYYTRLVDLLSKTKSNEVLATFSIDNTRETAFTVSFTSYDEAIIFVEELETPLFLEVFESITLSGLDVAQKSGVDYQLSLSGKFKPLAEDGT